MKEKEIRKKLNFYGYLSNDLDEVSEMYQLRTGEEPTAFVIQRGWEVTGSDMNFNLLVTSPYGGFASIYATHHITVDELNHLSHLKEMRYKDVTRINDGSVSEIDLDDYLEGLLSDDEGYTRRCNYCGKKYATDPGDIVYHCGDAECEGRDATEKIRYSSGGEAFRVVVDPLENYNLDNPNIFTVAGHVYMIEAENGLVKLGRSNDIKARFAALSTMSPVVLILRHLVYCKDYVASESKLHVMFADRRHHGEWFNLQKNELKWLMSLLDGDLD